MSMFAHFRSPRKFHQFRSYRGLKSLAYQEEVILKHPPWLSYSVWRSVRAASTPYSFKNHHQPLLHLRLLHVSAIHRKEPSSKIEVSVERLKEKQKAASEAIKEVFQQPQATKHPEPREDHVSGEMTKVSTVVKKSLWVRFKDEVKHYYSGFKLLFLDVKVSTLIVWKILQGKTLTRRESRQLVRTTSDLFRLVPFSVFVLVPFMEILLPVALKLFPGMLPSTFTTSSQRDAKMKKALSAKLEYAKFLQKTLDEMGPVDSNRSSQSARDFVSFYNEIKSSKDQRQFDNEQIMKFAKLFEDDITLDNMDRSQLSAICRLLNLTPIGTSNFLRLQIEMRLRHLRADDRLINKEGMDRMSHVELQVANQDRGMPAFGLSEERLRAQLGEWINLSLNAKVPPSLLLLSRTLYNVDTLAPTEKIAGAISALPQSAASATSASIGEREGKIRNVIRLEQIKEEQRKIEQEAVEQAKLEAHQAAVAAKVTPEILEEIPVPSTDQIVMEGTSTLRKATVSTTGEVKEKELLIDSAPILVDRAPEMKTEDQVEVLQEAKTAQEASSATPAGVAAKAKPVSASSLEDLKTAIESLGKTPTEVKKLGDIKKELEEYEEDVQELDEIRDALKRHDLKESTAAKRLFGRVNKMLAKTNVLVAKLQQKEEEIYNVKQRADRTEDQLEKDDENIVTIQELIEAVTKLQKSPDQSKVDQIAQVLAMMDEDADGVINVAHVLKVIELLGVENTELPAKQIKQIINVLSKEELLEVEDSIEDILLRKPAGEEVDEALQKDLNALEVATTSPEPKALLQVEEEKKDIYPVKDNFQEEKEREQKKNGGLK